MTGGRLRLLLSVPEGNKRSERKEKREKRRKVAVYEPWQQLKVLVLVLRAKGSNHFSLGAAAAGAVSLTRSIKILFLAFFG